ncbi:MAG: hypothetical protein QOD51_2855 [Candidatus Eremiobacteraeota bacterium]|jgi:uncharacterized repeat protein (TIGR01451 family)|nr:hypothetical protein [Candidatus Eremiobacteraeota bacterium]
MKPIALGFALVVLALSPALASAKPVVALTLSGSYVTKNDDGTPRFVPVERERARPGDRIRWQIDAKSTGDQPARGFAAVGRIPAGTAFVAGSQSASGAHVEYSLDGTRTWSASPIVIVQTPAGPVTRKADPAKYTAIRWLGGPPLAPGSVTRYTYEVTVR